MSISIELEMINVGIVLAQDNPNLHTFDKLSKVTEYLNSRYGVKVVRGMSHDHVYSMVKEAMKYKL